MSLPGSTALVRLPACLLIFLCALPASAAPPLFDTHLHYNESDAGAFTPQRIVRILQANGVHRAAVTGYPAEPVLDLYHTAPGLIVPLLGVYRSAADKQDWMRDTGLPERVKPMLERGPWRGVGELHLFAEQRHSPVFLRLVELATEHRLPLLMHCDPAVIDALFEHSPDARAIWAHAGKYPYPQILQDYLDRYPRLYVDLSMRDERIAPGGELDPDWENLLWEYPDRFLAGVDTFSPERWDVYGRVVKRMRHWLGQLPEAVADQIAYGNAMRLYGVTEEPKRRD